MARHGPRRARIAAVISLAVVLPLLPATPTIGIAKAARHAAASRCSATCGSGTTICGTPKPARSAPPARRLRRAAPPPRRTLAVELRSAERDEQRRRPRACACRSTRPRKGHPRRPAAPPATRAASLERALHAAPPRISALPSRSLNRRRDRAEDLIVLVALAGDQHHVPGAAAFKRLRDRGARSCTMRAAMRADPAGDRATISAGSSVRGLSSVTMI